LLTSLRTDTVNIQISRGAAADSRRGGNVSFRVFHSLSLNLKAKKMKNYQNQIAFSKAIIKIRASFFVAHCTFIGDCRLRYQAQKGKTSSYLLSVTFQQNREKNFLPDAFSREMLLHSS